MRGTRFVKTNEGNGVLDGGFVVMLNGTFIVTFRIKIIFLIILTNLIIVKFSYGAEFQTWSDITTIYRFNDRWQYDGDQGGRGVLGNGDSTTLYFRPSVEYRVMPRLTAHGGIRFFQTFNEDEDNTFEIGPWQGLRFAWPNIGNFLFSHYLRLEERMIWTEGDGDFDFTVRSRYKLGVRSPDYGILFKNGIFLMGSIEAFCNLETPLFVNQLRGDIGVGTKISDTWQVQLHYLSKWDKSSPGMAFSLDERILRLRLFYTF